MSFSKYIKDRENITRSYHSIRIERLDSMHNLNLIPEFSSHLQNLCISQTTIKNPAMLKKMLECLKLLKTLAFTRVQIEPEMDVHQDFPITSSKVLNSRLEIPSDDLKLTLKKLSMVQVDHRIIKFLPDYQVKNLEITDGTNRTDFGYLINFIRSQRKLDSLTIENLSDSPSALFEDEKYREINFKLKNLSILFSHIRDVDKFDENFVSFLKFQVASLEKLKVEGSLSLKVFKFIVGNFHAMKELEINVNELPQENSFYDFLGSNCTLRILKLNGTLTRSNLNGFKGILGHYRGIERISLADTDKFVANDVFHLLSVRITRLNDLSVLNLHESFAPNVNLTSLTKFSIKILNNIAQWKAFIERNVSLEVLHVGWIKRDQFTPQIIQEISELPNLRHLKFCGRFTACKQIYEVLKVDYKNLRTLELTVGNYDEIKILKFIFPYDKRLWMPKCLYFDEGSNREPLND